MAQVLCANGDDLSVQRAVQVLEDGGLVVFPTDTVYGVGASVNRADAVGKLYHAKGRPLERAIPVLVSGPEAVHRLVRDVDAASRALMSAFWPGPLTIVMPAQDWLPEEIVRGTGSVGLRMPDHPVALELIRECGGAVATTSANRSGEGETRTAVNANDAIGDRVDLVIDGGMTPGGVPSTVVRVDPDGDLEILREGAIQRASLLRALGRSSDTSDQ